MSSNTGMQKDQEDCESVDGAGGSADLCAIEESGWCPKIFGALIDDRDTHDVTFKTSDGSSVGTHRAMVATGSPVFRAMLYGNMRESSEKVIELKNVSSETFQYLLTFIYKGKVSFNFTNCLDVLDAAHYFGIDALESLCVDYIYDTLTIDNSYEVISFAHKKDYQVLLQKCLSLMFIHAVDMIRSPQFKELPTEVLFAFFESSEVHAKEIELFTAAIEWYQHQEDITGACDGLLGLIRYPLISKDDLLDKVRPVQEKDMALYTAALEYHLDAQRYCGPPQQTTLRKPWLEIISVTPDTIILKKTKNGTLVSRVGAKGWNGCAIRVGPQKQTLQFLVSSNNYVYCKLVTANNDESLSCEINTDDLAEVGKEETITVKVYVSQRTSKPICKLKFDGVETLYTSVKKDTPIFLCIYLYNVGDELRITQL